MSRFGHAQPLAAAAVLLALAACTTSSSGGLRLGEQGGGASGDGPAEGEDTGGGEDSGGEDSGAGGGSEGGEDSAGEGEEADIRVVVSPDYLNLHEGPSGADPVIRALHCGTEVTVTGERDGDWLPVTAEGESGWVKKRKLEKLAQLEGDPCPGPDAYLDDTPETVVDTLSTVPYVEQDCAETTWEGWPFEAQRCVYNDGLVVTVADPSAEQVTAWIADASQLIPALWALEERDRGAWKKGLKVIAEHTLYQSSRIFPLEGEIDEGIVYDFDRGVTEGCTTGCYCRINSLSRQQWCDYAANVLGSVDESECLDEYSTTTWTEAWADHCLDMHRAAWTGVHHHYRAMAWWANQTVEAVYPDPESADPDAVVDLLESLY